ncbi:MAG TPA: translesion DNA synthesis-associated protein ImuA [Thiolapillus brandeum]|uniref:Translesion DNA synthesis-associated protein ImuA n=1 Tax=Thiolapillus brandeum TaxID=1076588 RepID=A0A7C5MX10_9GAMM|nr:translesion DNA synthesis-associated protein ImuA [Thiolapillus brandeum]
MAAEASLESLLHRGLLWRGNGREGAAGRALSSGFRELDEATGGGWPSGALVELVSPGGQGLSLLVPLLVRLGREPRWLAWVDPPWHPHAPALAARGVAVSRILQVRTAGGAEGLWAAEQLLRSGNCAVVMLWPGRLGTARLRRLQLAAEEGDCLGVLFRSPEAVAAPSPAALRLRLGSRGGKLAVEVLKRRGGWNGGRVEVPCTG